MAGDKVATSLSEFGSAVDALETKGITLHVFEDNSKRKTPDSLEHWSDIIGILKLEYRVRNVKDYFGVASDSLGSGGTDGMALAHYERRTVTVSRIS